MLTYLFGRQNPTRLGGSLNTEVKRSDMHYRVRGSGQKWRQARRLAWLSRREMIRSDGRVT